MGYKLKFTLLQANFIITACQFGELDYASLRQIWEFSGGEMSKIPSSLIKKLEDLSILQVKRPIVRNGSENLYQFNQTQAKAIFTDIGITPIPYSFGEGSPVSENAELEARYENHDQLLQTLCVQTLGKFKGYRLSFPKNRSFNLLVPDAIYQKESPNYSLYLEYDNLTERTVDFSAKLPRYIQYFEQEHQPMSLVYVFKEEPLVRISHLLTALTLTSTIQRQPTLDWLREHSDFKVYFLTTKLWQELSASLAQLPEHASSQLEAFNVVHLLKDEKMATHLIREKYKRLLESVLGATVISTDEEEINLFNAQTLEKKEERRAFL